MYMYVTIEMTEILFGYTTDKYNKYNRFDYSFFLKKIHVIN